MDAERKGKDVIVWVPGPGLKAAFAFVFVFEPLGLGLRACSHAHRSLVEDAILYRCST